MSFIKKTGYAYGSFPNSGPVTAYASAGGTSQSTSDGPRPIPVGGTILTDAKVPVGSGTSAAGHGDVKVNSGYAFLTATAFKNDAISGATAQGSATEGTVVVATSPYLVRFRPSILELRSEGSVLFTQLRIVELHEDEFDQRSFPESADPKSPLIQMSSRLTPVLPSDEDVLFVEQVTVDENGNLDIVTYGASLIDDMKLTPDDFSQTQNGTYKLRKEARTTRRLEVHRPAGCYFVRFQYTWGIGVLPSEN